MTVPPRRAPRGAQKPRACVPEAPPTGHVGLEIDLPAELLFLADRIGLLDQSIGKLRRQLVTRLDTVRGRG